jgi:hypothetical protein
MAKSQTARSTIKNDPFATLIPDREAEQAAAEEEANEVAPNSVAASSVAQNSVVTPLRRDQARETHRVQAETSQAAPGRVDSGKADGQKKEKLTVHLTHDLIERVKNAAYWNPRLTIASIAELGVKYAIEQVEKENGGPYPARESELKGGRPIGS